MKKILKNYKMTIVLIISVIIGGICGLIFHEKVAVVKPLGDLFLNMMFIVIIPLIFLTITTSVAKMDSPKRLRKVIITTFIIFTFASLVSVFIGLLSTNISSLVNVDEISITEVENSNSDINILEKTVNLLSVNDFYKLLSKDNIIALLVFSLIVGFSIRISKNKKVLDVIDSSLEVVQNALKIIMYYAPIGIGVYFATLIGTFGESLAIGYVKTFIVYLVSSLVMYFIVYTLYAFIAYGKRGIVLYYKNMISPTVMALSTCSSAACIPVNQTSIEKMGIKKDIAGTVVPLGTSFHKDGSVIGSVFKVMFLVNLFSTKITLGNIIIISLIATLLVTAVPIGGGSISEIFILTMLGLPITYLPILTIIATIIDAPATVLNVIGDMSSSMLISRIVDGKNINVS